jgi:hypothetical protein
MKIYFYRLGDYDNFAAAKGAKAVRCILLDDAANPSLRLGRAADIVDAIVEAVDLVGGGEPLQFILTSDEDIVLDVF